MDIFLILGPIRQQRSVGWLVASKINVKPPDLFCKFGT